jgi:hypothetical protein
MAALVDKAMGALNEARKPMYPLFEKPQSAFCPYSYYTIFALTFADDLRTPPVKEERLSD